MRVADVFPNDVLRIIVSYWHIWGLWAHYVSPSGTQVWVGFEASWRGEPLVINSSLMYRRTQSSCTEGHMAASSEGHFLSILFGRTLFEYCVWKDTF